MSKIFYHSTTGEQFRPSECSEDSEDDLDSTWIQEMEEKVIEELSDVNCLEKSFMKLWNKHVYEINSPVLHPNLVCIKFVERYHKEIAKMRDQWTLHLLTLLEYRVLTGDNLFYLCLLLKSLIL